MFSKFGPWAKTLETCPHASLGTFWKTRIAMLPFAKRAGQSPSPRAVAVLLLFAVLTLAAPMVSLSLLPAAPPEVAADSGSIPAPAEAPPEAIHMKNQKYYVTGLVFEEQTRFPIAGAKVTVFIESEQEPDQRLLQAVSDATGRYRIEVPLGFVRLRVYPKAGYWSPDVAILPR